MPGSSVESSLNIFLRADDDEIDHVAEVVELIVDSARQAIQVLAEVGIQGSIRDLEDGHSGGRGGGAGGRGCRVCVGGPRFRLIDSELALHEDFRRVAELRPKLRATGLSSCRSALLYGNGQTSLAGRGSRNVHPQQQMGGLIDVEFIAGSD